jgi:hypothetical protein
MFLNGSRTEKREGVKMATIELAGRLRERVNLEGKSYESNDVNLDKDFLIYLSRSFIKMLGINENGIKLKNDRIIAEEIIRIIDFDINIQEQKYHFKFTRDTIGDKIIIGVKINPIEFKDNELFGTIYDLKIKTINLLNSVCANLNVYVLQDYNNELICQNAYLELHKIENKFRSILTKYLIKKNGNLVLSRPLKKEVDGYSEWFRKIQNDKYKTFKRINTDYSNLNFSNLVELLDLYDTNCVDDSGKTIKANLENILEEMTGGIDCKDLNSNIQKLKNVCSKRIKIFDDVSAKQQCDKDFGLKDEDLRTILDTNFRALWTTDFANMRNMIAHNKPICKELHTDFFENCRIVNEKFDKCFEYIDTHFYSDEEGVLSYLEELEYEKDAMEYHYIEQGRENASLEFELSDEYVENELIENSKEIRHFINTVSVLGDMQTYVECIDGMNEDLRYIDNSNITIEFKLKIFNIIKDVMSLDCDFEVYTDIELWDMVYELIYKDIDIDDAISFYLDRSFTSPMDDRFECFNMDYQIKWLAIDGKEYAIDFYSDLEPENNGTDYLEFNLYIDKRKVKKYEIEVFYGDYHQPTDGAIRYEELYELIDYIESSIEETVDTYKKIYEISEKILELL